MLPVYIFFGLLALSAVGLWTVGTYFGFWGKSIEKPLCDSQIRVACIGDSITYGMKIPDRRHHCYPADLQKMLGDSYNVRNYGLNNRNAMRESPFPYNKEKQFERSLAFCPDIVLLMLGTNDSKKEVWKGKDIWRDDYGNLIDSYQKLPSCPRIYLLTPASVYATRQKNGETGIYANIQDAAIAEICGAIYEIAEERDLTVIDINTATAGQRHILNRDGVHPNCEGAVRIANVIYRRLTGQTSTSNSL